MEKINGLFAAIKISSTGLAAQRRRMNVIAENIANSTTTHTEEGGPYKRKIMSFREKLHNASFSSVQPNKGGRIGLETTSKDHLQSKSGGVSSNTRDERFSGVNTSVEEDNSDPTLVYDPHHPDADEAGFVKMPNISVITEMVDMITATRAYEANVTAVKTAKLMAQKALEI